MKNNRILPSIHTTENIKINKNKKEDTYVRFILFYQKIYRMGFKRLGKTLYWLNRLIFSCDFPCEVIVGKNLCLPHFGLGLVVNPKAVIGDNCKIYHQVTIGARNKEWMTVIGNNVLIGTGAKILGSITLGDGSKIGANSVVLKDVPPNATAVGIPARNIEHKK